MTDVIPLHRLAFALLPVVLVLALMIRWSLGFRAAMIGVIRMVLQLALVGYLLGYIFSTDTSLVVIGVLTAMLIAASWISLRSIPSDRRRNFRFSFLAILLGAGSTFLVMTQIVLGLDPWFAPRVFIPLAGMTLSSSMNSVSLAAERYYAEIQRGSSDSQAREVALKAAFIPITNSLYAVGIVSIPGMMTGQVLAGVSPLIAARYQIMVMCMIFGSAGLSAAFFLWLIGRSESHPKVSEDTPVA
tara:strand:- start:25887 stop:26618 length:732 start_codon:yes stop_codon:yes gene_type:complete